MRNSYSFIFCCLLLLGVLKGWSKIVPTQIDLDSEHPLSVPVTIPLVASVSTEQTLARRDLLESLHHLVARENYYRSVYGKFTPHLGRVGYAIPSKVSESYEVRVVEASETRLLISAFETESGSEKQGDLASIDQFYHLEANFAPPMPRPEFLRVQAQKHLRLVKDAQPGLMVSEEGVYKDYFRYEIREDSRGNRVAFAVGIRPPVMGVQLESNDSDSGGGGSSEEMLSESVPDEVSQSIADSNAVGQKPEGSVMSSSEEAYLAQQIFHGEMGRYARNWAELTKITNFNFNDKDSASELDLHAGSDRQIASKTAADPDLSSNTSSSASANPSGLIIEPLN